VQLGAECDQSARPTFPAAPYYHWRFWCGCLDLYSLWTNRGHRRDGGGHPSRPVALRPAGTQRISVHIRSIISGGTEALESDRGMPVSVYRGYGTRRVGGATQGADCG